MKKEIPNGTKTNSICTRLFFLFCLIFIQLGYAQNAVSGFFNKKGQIELATNLTYKSGKELFAGKEIIAIVPAEFEAINTQIVNLFANYSVKDWLTITANIPYIYVYNKNNILDPVNNEATQQGFQDIELYSNFRLIFKKYNSGYFTTSGGLSFTTPLSNYKEQGVISLGNGATTINPFFILQYKFKKGLFFETFYSHSFKKSRYEFKVPDADLYNFKIGYARQKFYGDIRLTIQNSVNGTDIFSDEFWAQGGLASFPNNKVDFTNLSVNLYYPITNKIGISTFLTQTLDGRNVRKEKGISLGLVYTMNNK